MGHREENEKGSKPVHGQYSFASGWMWRNVVEGPGGPQNPNVVFVPPGDRRNGLEGLAHRQANLTKQIFETMSSEAEDASDKRIQIFDFLVDLAHYLDLSRAMDLSLYMEMLREKAIDRHNHLFTRTEPWEWDKEVKVLAKSSEEIPEIYEEFLAEEEERQKMEQRTRRRGRNTDTAEEEDEAPANEDQDSDPADPLLGRKPEVISIEPQISIQPQINADKDVFGPLEEYLPEVHSSMIAGEYDDFRKQAAFELYPPRASSHRRSEDHEQEASPKYSSIWGIPASIRQHIPGVVSPPVDCCCGLKQWIITTRKNYQSEHNSNPGKLFGALLDNWHQAVEQAVVKTRDSLRAIKAGFQERRLSRDAARGELGDYVSSGVRAVRAFRKNPL